MWYWNKENFDGLEGLAEAFRRDGRSSALGDYCDLRSKGLRKQALSSLDEFLASFSTWTVADQRAWTNRLMELQVAHPEVHQLIAHPLKQALVAVLEHWIRDEELVPAPHRWLGVLTKEPWRFVQALALDDGDLYSRWQVAKHLIRVADFACHEIPQGLLDDVDETRRCLDEADEILGRVADAEQGRAALEQVRSIRRKLEDWVAFLVTNEDDFDVWCLRERGYAWRRSRYDFNK